MAAALAGSSSVTLPLHLMQNTRKPHEATPSHIQRKQPKRHPPIFSEIAFWGRGQHKLKLSSDRPGCPLQDLDSFTGQTPSPLRDGLPSAEAHSQRVWRWISLGALARHIHRPFANPADKAHKPASSNSSSQKGRAVLGLKVLAIQTPDPVAAGCAHRCQEGRWSTTLRISARESQLLP